jgi:hypothetical protein
VDGQLSGTVVDPATRESRELLLTTEGGYPRLVITRVSARTDIPIVGCRDPNHLFG